MDAIFGPTETPELFSPKNGLIVNSEFEAVFDKGLLAIVPLLPNDPSTVELGAWRNSEPKEYKIRILDHKHEKINILSTSYGWGFPKTFAMRQISLYWNSGFMIPFGLSN
jgi:hypothetical protein